MGLDMYLYVETYQGAPKDKAWFNHSICLTCVAYWRKENHIHDWFVTNVQDGADECQRSAPFYADKIKELITLCKEVIQDPSKGPDLLPTKVGFFFGPTEYDESYIAGCVDTVKQLEAVLAEYPEGEFIYRSSW